MGRIPDDIITQVIERCDIVEIVSQFVSLKKAGRNFKACCPFHHEKTPSFMVNPDKQIFHCFGCGVGGNAVSFLMKHDGLSFPEAVRDLARKVNVEIPDTYSAVKTQSSKEKQTFFKINELAISFYHENLLKDKSTGAQKARDYLKARGVELDTVKTFRLGFAPDAWEDLIHFMSEKSISPSVLEQAGLVLPRDKGNGHYDRFRNRIVFPIFDTRANPRAFGARIFQEDDTSGAKYINSPETPIYTKGHHVFGFHLARPAIIQQDEAIIAEGYLDCIMPYQHGVKNIVASLGTSLTEEQVRLLRRYTRHVVLVFDQDQAGQAATLRSLEMFITEGMKARIATLTKGEDPDSYISKNGMEAFLERIEKAKPLFDYKLEILMEQFDCQTVDGKASVCDAMLPTIALMENAVLKSGYIRQLSGALRIPEYALEQELAKIGQKTKTQTGPLPLEEKRPPVAVRAVEYSFLKLLLEEEKFVEQSRKEVELSDFQDENIRRIIEAMFNMFELQGSVDTRQLVSQFDDESTASFLSSILAQDHVEGNREKMCRDVIQRIKTDRIKTRKQVLLQQIYQAESTGDIQLLEKLKKDFNQLTRK